MKTYVVVTYWQGASNVLYNTCYCSFFYGEMEKIAPENYSRIIVNYSHTQTPLHKVIHTIELESQKIRLSTTRTYVSITD